MARYSMSQVELLTGIKAATLRKWEERYGFLTPGRTETNIRYYSDAMVRMLLNISILVRNGYRVSTVGEMGEAGINEQVMQIVSNPSDDYSDVVDALIASMVNMDEAAFDVVFKSHVAQLGLLLTFQKIIHPFLERVGILWGTSKVLPSQEHFVANLIRQKLIVATETLPTPKQKAPKILMFLPEGELHEVALLFSSFIAKERGWKVYYLGQNVPLENMQSALEISNPDALLTIITSPRADDAQAFIGLILGKRKMPFLLGGQSPFVEELKSDKRLSMMTNPEELIKFLDVFVSKKPH